MYTRHTDEHSSTEIEVCIEHEQKIPVEKLQRERQVRQQCDGRIGVRLKVSLGRERTNGRPLSCRTRSSARDDASPMVPIVHA